MTMYKADYADEEFEIIDCCETDTQAMREAYKFESVHGDLFNLFEIDENYNEIRTIF